MRELKNIGLFRDKYRGPFFLYVVNSLWEKGNASQEGETADLSINLDAGRLR